MSESDPYAPEVEEAKTFEEPVTAEAPQEAPEAAVDSVPEGSVKDVLAWVGTDVTKAQKALDAEKSGDKRSSLISKLEAVIN